MKIISVSFDYAASTDYARLMAAFRASCARHMPAVAIEELRLSAPMIRPGKTRGEASNTHKLRAWVKAIDHAAETVCFADCDMLALRSIEDVEALDFDLAYTVRTKGWPPMNGGVVFVRPTDMGRALVKRWNQINTQMYRDDVLHNFWKRKYAGMNQAAFGCLLANHGTRARIITLPCAEWNACNEDWATINGSTRLMHIKGELRRMVLGYVATPPALERAVREWREYGE